MSSSSSSSVPAQFFGGATVLGGGGGASGGGASTMHAFLDHVFDTSFQGRKDLLNAIQYCLVAAVLLMPFLAALDALVPEANFHTSTGVLLLEIAVHLILLVLIFVLVHRVTTFLPTYSGVQHSPISFSGAMIPLLIVLFSSSTKLCIKATIIGDRLRRAMRLAPRKPPSPSARPFPSVSAAWTPGGTTPGQIASIGGSVDPGAGGAAIPIASLPMAPSAATTTGTFSPMPAAAVLGPGW